MDAHGKPVNVPADTLDISKHGARLSGVTCWDSPGETVGIRCGTEKARYQVMWVGPAGTPIFGHIGVRCVDVGRNIWGVNLDEIPGSPDHGLSARKQPPVRRFIDSRRRHQRYVVTGSANVREFSKNIPHWTHLNDLSMGGCYVKTIVPYSVKTPVAVTIHIEETRIDSLGMVVVKDPLVGMAIKFTDMSPVDRQRLQGVINHLVELGDRTLGRRRI